jgi:hypothetical protein
MMYHNIHMLSLHQGISNMQYFVVVFVIVSFSIISWPVVGLLSCPSACAIDKITCHLTLLFIIRNRFSLCHFRLNIFPRKTLVRPENPNSDTID